jgi:hypothetical protein
MSRSMLRSVLLLFPLALVSTRAEAGRIDFEDFVDSEDLASVLVDGVTLSFTNATVLMAGLSLNEFDFPPASGQNVAVDNGAPMTIVFSTPIFGFSGLFTYGAPLTVQAFDPTNALIATVLSGFSSNAASSGDAGSLPNELLQLTAGNIASIVIRGDALGGSFTLDDLNFTSTAVPEPSTLLLVGVGALGVMARARRKRI